MQRCAAQRRTNKAAKTTKRKIPEKNKKQKNCRPTTVENFRAKNPKTKTKPDAHGSIFDYYYDDDDDGDRKVARR